jgi:hypothetical protein
VTSAANMAPPHPFVSVMRRYVIDYLVCQNTSVCAQIMEPDYVLRMADAVLGPRDDVYVPAVAAQLKQFPGMGMTVHDLWLSEGEAEDRSEDRLAMLFSQHGASTSHAGAVAGWLGIGIYRWNGSRLTSNTALEDYEGRREQLVRTAGPAVLPPPAFAPWDEQPQSASASAETAVKQWLSSPDWMDHPGVVCDSGAGAALQLAVAQTTVTECVSSGNHVAFAATVDGVYLAGLDVPGDRVGTPAVLHLMGMVRADAQGRCTGQIVTGRGPLRRALLAVRPSPLQNG